MDDLVDLFFIKISKKGNFDGWPPKPIFHQNFQKKENLIYDIIDPFLTKIHKNGIFIGNINNIFDQNFQNKWKNEKIFNNPKMIIYLKFPIHKIIFFRNDYK